MNYGKMNRVLGLGYRDRRDAGAALGKELLKRRDWNDPVVLALPRGGVPVAAEVARLLEAPLDILVVRKIGHPRHEEFAIGAIASGGTMVMNSQSASFLADVPQAEIDRIIAREQGELQRREKLYRGDHPATPVRGREVIIVDDGLATGATMRAAVQAIRQLQPARVTVAVPVGARESCDALEAVADDVVCVRTPEPFTAVGLWYSEFPQTSDDEVRAQLAASYRYMASRPGHLTEVSSR
jgi:putative phosphoribosyl transferase